MEEFSDISIEQGEAARDIRDASFLDNSRSDDDSRCR
jgi:hypothetical protein